MPQGGSRLVEDTSVVDIPVEEEDTPVEVGDTLAEVGDSPVVEGGTPVEEQDNLADDTLAADTPAAVADSSCQDRMVEVVLYYRKLCIIKWSCTISELLTYVITIKQSISIYIHPQIRINTYRPGLYSIYIVYYTE